MMGTIKLRNIRTFSHHGCLEEEARIGSEYRVDMEIRADLQKASETDELEDTVDYVFLNQVVKDEMAIRSKLLETVAKRIIDRVLGESGMVSYIKISVAKINPPIGGDVESVAVELEEERKV